MANDTTNARLASMDQLLRTIVMAHLDPAPSRETLRGWFKDLPQFKSNPTAKRGGGTVYYSVPHVEKFFRSRIMPGKVL